MPAPVDTSLPARYRDSRPIAQGGMGEIFLARDEILGREVAIKVLAQRYAQDAGLRERFKREALAAARLSGNHNIVTIFDVDEHDGRPIIVMEYLAGGSLDKRIEGRPCKTGQAIEWLDDAAAALDAAHDAGIVHRDVKPGNLLLDDRGRVKVADFGIASAAGMDSFTQTGTILGTAGYLSPEQARGERATAASDRYALAIVAWELLTGRRPFQAESPTAEAVAHVNAPIPSVRAANPTLPASFDAIFERALAKDPAARYPHASEFVGELRGALHDDAGDTFAPAAAVVAAPTRVMTRSDGRRWLVPLLVLALVAGGALAAFLATRSSTTKAQTRPRTIITTVTGPGETVRQTVTAATPPPPPTTAPATTAPTTTAATTTAAATTSAAPASGGSGSQLNNAGYAKMRAGDYAGALPLLQQAVQKLSGTGSTDEAYADFNLAYTTRKLGQCTNVLPLLDRSQAIQGHRSEIDALRADAQKSCG